MKLLLTLIALGSAGIGSVASAKEVSPAVEARIDIRAARSLDNERLRTPAVSSAPKKSETKPEIICDLSDSSGQCC